MKRSAEIRQRADKLGAFSAQLAGQHVMATVLGAAAADLREFAAEVEAREKAQNRDTCAELGRLLVAGGVTRLRE